MKMITQTLTRNSKKIAPSPFRGLHSILETLKKDHDDLRGMIEVLTSDRVNLAKKKKTYQDFSKLLKAHAKVEEIAVYEMALRFKDLKMATYEAYEEHAAADTLMGKVAHTPNPDQWQGRVKFLAEAVKHHIIEEEGQFLKDLQKKIDADTELDMIQKFISLRMKRPKKPTEEHAGILKQR